MAKFIEANSKAWGLITINVEQIKYITQEVGCIKVAFSDGGWLEFLYTKEEFLRLISK
jgi:hypothetical protein